MEWNDSRKRVIEGSTEGNKNENEEKKTPSSVTTDQSISTADNAKKVKLSDDTEKSSSTNSSATFFGISQAKLNPSSFSGGLFSCISKSPPPMSISIAKPKIVSSTFDLAKKTTMNSEAPKPTWAVPKSTSSSHVLNTSTSFSFSTTTSPFQSSSLNSTTSLFQSHLNSTTTPAASPFSSSTWSTFTTLKSPQPPKEEEKKKEEPLAEPKEAKKESLAEPKEANKEEPKEDKKDSSFSSQPIVSKKPNIIPIGQGIEAKPKEEVKTVTEPDDGEVLGCYHIHLFKLQDKEYRDYGYGRLKITRYTDPAGKDHGLCIVRRESTQGGHATMLLLNNYLYKQQTYTKKEKTNIILPFRQEGKVAFYLFKTKTEEDCDKLLEDLKKGQSIAESYF